MFEFFGRSMLGIYTDQNRERWSTQTASPSAEGDRLDPITTAAEVIVMEVGKRSAITLTVLLLSTAPLWAISWSKANSLQVDCDHGKQDACLELARVVVNSHNYQDQGLWDAVVSLTDQDTLANIAEKAKDVGFRILALNHLTDQDMLAKIATNDNDPHVREFAIKRLSKVRDVYGIAPSPHGQVADQVSQLIGQLKDSQFKVRVAAADRLVRFGDPAVMPLIGALKDLSPDARLLAADALGRIGDPRAVEPLIAILQDADSGVREHAVAALGQLGDPRAAAALANEHGAAIALVTAKVQSSELLTKIVRGTRTVQLIGENLRQEAIEDLPGYGKVFLVLDIAVQNPARSFPLSRDQVTLRPPPLTFDVFQSVAPLSSETSDGWTIDHGETALRLVFEVPETTPERLVLWFGDHSLGSLGSLGMNAH